MKKKRFLIYLASALIPVAIFFICASINGYVPIGSELLNSYDSFTQYPGIILEYANLLRNGNIFYSWGAGLGFNFFGTLTYYGMSPLNILAIFANSNNYYMYIAIMTFIRFGLLGLSMCFYLDHKKIKPLYVVLLSTAYALMGYTSTYYYNYIWIDSIIMLPIVMYGLDKLIEGKSPLVYIISLTFTILINYYIGYMICIFSLVWFLYNIINVKNKKPIIKAFIISSVLAGLMGAITLLPSMFALLTGKAELYKSISYFGASRNVLTFLYTLTPGAYQMGDQMYGQALIYSSTLVFVSALFFFFNKSFSKREKVATLVVLIFFYLSFSLNILNYAWHLFQRPIWWQSRFSFVFSFFLIVLASKVLMNIDKTEFKTKYRIIFSIILTIGIIIGAIVKWQVQTSLQFYTYIYLGLGIILLIEMIFLLDKKGFIVMLAVFTFVELSLNTFNSLKNNYRYMSYSDYQYIKDEVPKINEKLKLENDNFYRMEFMNDYTSNDGLYFGFNGINYFNSVRNINVINLFTALGIKVSDKCHIELDELDPVILSLLNIKYLYGNNSDYLKKIDTRLYENEFPLALGFMAESNIKDLKLNSEGGISNREKVIDALLGEDINLYEIISDKSFTKEKEGYYTKYKYTFTAEDRYILMPGDFRGSITVNGETTNKLDYKNINKNDSVKVEYTISEEETESVYLALLNYNEYTRAMNVLNKNIMHARTNTNGHILEGSITVSDDDKYLFTSIEYENGMKVYVDGKEIEPDIVLGTLIGFSLDKGEHEIVIDYIPKGLVLGSIISTVSLATALFYLQKFKKAL